MGSYSIPSLVAHMVGHMVGHYKSIKARLVEADAPLLLCPRQDSNLGSRLRRPMLYPLSYGGEPTVDFPIGRVKCQIHLVGYSSSVTGLTTMPLR
jgi:hypothetical protein